MWNISDNLNVLFHMGVNTLTPLRKKVTIILEEVDKSDKKKKKKTLTSAQITLV